MRIGSKTSLLLAMSLLATPLFAEQGDPPARVARLSFLKGKVSLQRVGENQWSEASLNFPLTAGDRIYADRDSNAEIEAGSIAARLSDGTDLTFATLDDQFMQLGVAQGVVRLRVYELPPGNGLEVDSPNGALTILGPGDYRIDSNPEDGVTYVIVDSGSLEVSGGGISQTLRAGQAVRLTGADSIQVAFVAMPEPDGFDRWSRERDRRYLTADAGQYVSREIPGYADLDDYGRWQDTADYGPVWSPVSVPVDWVPYRHGHWVWVEPWGWTWMEDAPWGFAPFHYGRWVRIGSSWAWVPGPRHVRPYYAPALVVFVGGPSFSIGIGFGGGSCHAWFPLGPGEPYRPWYRHGDHYFHQVNVTNVTNINITNIRNVNEVHYVNRVGATTAVPTPIFRSGQPIARHVIPVNERQIRDAQIIARPDVTPAGDAARGGRLVSTPPARNPRLIATPITPRRPYRTPEAPALAPGSPSVPNRPERTQVIDRNTSEARQELRNEAGPPRTRPPQPNPSPVVRERPSRPPQTPEAPPHAKESHRPEKPPEQQKPEKQADKPKHEKPAERDKSGEASDEKRRTKQNQ